MYLADVQAYYCFAPGQGGCAIFHDKVKKYILETLK
jgi:hypothetical protein